MHRQRQGQGRQAGRHRAGQEQGKRLEHGKGQDRISRGRNRDRDRNRDDTEQGRAGQSRNKDMDRDMPGQNRRPIL